MVRLVLFSVILLLVHFLAKGIPNSFSMPETGHLQKLLATLSRNTNYLYFLPATWSIIKSKGLPFLWDQAVLLLPLAQTQTQWYLYHLYHHSLQHFLINKLSQGDRCCLSTFLERKGQSRQSPSKTSQLPSVQLGQ